VHLYVSPLTLYVRPRAFLLARRITVGLHNQHHAIELGFENYGSLANVATHRISFSDGEMLGALSTVRGQKILLRAGGTQVVSTNVLRLQPSGVSGFIHGVGDANLHVFVSV